MNTWREWLYMKLTTESTLLALVPAERVKAAGSLTGSPPERPFVLYRVGSETTRMNAGDVPLLADQDASVWIYDEPGSYVRIETYLSALREGLAGQVSDVVGAHACAWQGTSGELADDEMKCSTKFASLRLVGGVQ